MALALTGKVVPYKKGFGPYPADVYNVAFLTSAATQAELQNLFAHLERELDACGFLRNAEARPGMIRNLRSMWQRAGLTEQEAVQRIEAAVLSTLGLAPR